MSSLMAKQQTTAWARSKYGYIFNLATWLARSKNASASMAVFSKDHFRLKNFIFSGKKIVEKLLQHIFSLDRLFTTQFPPPCGWLVFRKPPIHQTAPPQNAHSAAACPSAGTSQQSKCWLQNKFLLPFSPIRQKSLSPSCAILLSFFAADFKLNFSFTCPH